VSIVNRGFRRRGRAEGPSDRVPPGQYVTSDFPVLSAGPTPRVGEDQWRFSLTGSNGEEASWTWREFTSLPMHQVTVDIHCVTKWSKLGTSWEGVSLDTLIGDFPGTHALFRSHGGYTTNLTRDDITAGKAMIAIAYDGKPLEPEHGGPARLLVPHLYFWKSAKWVEGVDLSNADRPGFWESYGYHNHGDPWLEQRYSGD
jgi:DMSO/TMAO reductase YedYZ molybdopterin-dependent catalytic subunit